MMKDDLRDTGVRMLQGCGHKPLNYAGCVTGAVLPVGYVKPGTCSLLAQGIRPN